MNSGIAALMLTAVLLLSACSPTIGLADLQPTGTPNHQLPKLKPYIEIASLENAYSRGSTIGTSGSTTGGGIIPGTLVTSGTFASVSKSDPRVNDFVTIFERDVRDNLTKREIGANGSISVRISNSITNRKILWGRFAISTAGAFLPMIFGLPIEENSFILELDVSFYNAQAEEIATYTVVGSDSYRANVYSGKNMSRTRLLNANAIKSALSKLKIRVEEDYEYLNGNL